MMTGQGHFITLEGGEGSGKSTQAHHIQQFLKEHAIDAILTREPGGSEGAERIRDLLVQGKTDAWDASSEYLLFSAARRHHLVHKIWPALQTGQWVICDRYYDSSRAYQGVGQHLDMTFMDHVYQHIAGSFQPDLTLIFDINPEVGLKRALQRRHDEDRYEQMDIQFHHCIRQAYLDIARDDSKRCQLIQAQESVENVTRQILDILKSHFPQSLS